MIIKIDAEYVLAEVREAADIHGLTEQQVEAIEKLDDDTIMQVMDIYMDDEFWDALDTVRCRTISRLARIVDEEIEG